MTTSNWERANSGHLVDKRVRTNRGFLGRVEYIRPERWWAFGRPRHTTWFYIKLEDSGRSIPLERHMFQVVDDE
jgi:hypothetical protein